jgi:16S rRNA (uracil1498-N3)-methyltransferase
VFRFFCPPENISKDRIIITDGKEIHHILNVLRKKMNDEVSIFDGKNFEYSASIEKISPKRLILKIKEKRYIPMKEELKIAVGCAIPKRGRFSLIVEKLTELGVKRIIPLETARSQVLLPKTRKERVWNIGRGLL